MKSISCANFFHSNITSDADKIASEQFHSIGQSLFFTQDT